MNRPDRKFRKFATLFIAVWRRWDTDTALRMDEHEFRKHAEEALSVLRRALAAASDDYDFTTDLEDDVLTVEFESPPAKFVISPHALARQIWVAAHSKSYRLEWDYVENAFMYRGQTLKEIVEQAITKQLGEEVTL
jgi:CyaY protein